MVKGVRAEKIVGNAGENLTVFKLSMLGYAASTVKQDGVDIAVVGGKDLVVAQRVEVKTILEDDKDGKFSFLICKGSDRRCYTRQVDLTMEQERYYQSLKKTSVAFLEGGEMVTTPEVMTRLLRLQQLLCGYLVTDEGEVKEIENNRLDVLLEVIEEMEGKVIVWSRFRHDIMKIANKLNQIYGASSVVTYFGDTSMAQRDEAIARFQDPGDPTRFFVSNPQTGGMGLTLHAATNVIYYSNDFNLESRIQSEDRAHRVGQHNPVLYVDLVSPNTVDVHIVKTLLNKNRLANITLGERVLEWLKV